MIQAIAHWIYASFQFTSKTIVIFIIRDALVESLCPNYFVCQRFRKRMPLHNPRMQSRGTIWQTFIRIEDAGKRTSQKRRQTEENDESLRHYYARTHRTAREHMFLLSVFGFFKKFFSQTICGRCAPSWRTQAPDNHLRRKMPNAFSSFLYTHVSVRVAAPGCLAAIHMFAKIVQGSMNALSVAQCPMWR